MIFGMDVGRHFDQSVLLGLNDKTIEPIVVLHGMDFVSQAKIVKDKVGDATVYIDITGLGRGLADILLKINRVRIVPITIGFGDTVKRNPPGIWVGKQYLVSLVNMSLGHFKIGSSVSEPVRNEFKNQMRAMRVKPGRVARFEGKSGTHDDLVIAYGLALLGGLSHGEASRRVQEVQQDALA